MENSKKLSLAVAAILLTASVGVRAEDAPAAPAAPAATAPAAPATPAAPDTSNWKCSKCAFDKGYRSQAELGAAYVDEPSAKFGDYTGLDDDGAYALAGAEGGVALESGYRLDYSLQDLGLDSRSATIEGGKQGHYEFGLSYDRIPHTIADTSETIYDGVKDQALPSGWVRAGSTAGMTALGSSLHPVDVGYDRDRYGAFGRFFLGDRWSFGLDYKRDDRSGTRPRMASFGSVSTELLRPIDDATDRLDATVRYDGKHWFAKVGYFASIYDTKAESFRFQNAFDAMAAGGDVGQMALEPDNTYNEVSVALGWYELPGHSTFTLSAAMGQGKQDTNFLPYTVNPTITLDALPFANLDGDVSVTRADATFSSRPIDRLRLRAAVSYDERDNDSRQGDFTSIVHTDLFPITEDRVNAIYGFERTRLTGSADFDVYDDLTVGVGGEYKTTDRTGTEQEVMSETLTDGYGKVQYRPSGWLGFVARGGVEERDPDKYDTSVAAAYGQNPLMRKYQMAYRYRAYGEFLADVAIGSLPLTLGMNAHYGDDSYLQSDMGLVAGLDRRYGADLTWTLNENVSAYLSASREKIDSKTKNSSVFGAPDWRGFVQDDYESYGAGVTAKVSEKLHLNLDYTYGAGDTHTSITGVASGSFPTVKSELSSFRVDATWAFNPRTDFVLAYWYETLDTSDWAYSSSPVVLPTVLGLGIDPYNYGVNYVGLSVRYRFGAVGGEEEAAAE